MADDPAPLLRGAGEEAGHVDEGQQGDIEGVAHAHEARGLGGGVDVEHAGHRARLVADDADRVAVQPREPDHDVLGVVLVDLEELAVVDHEADHVADVVGLVGAVGDDRVQRLVHPRRVVGGLHPRRGLEVVGRQEVQQVARVLEARVLVLGREMGDAGLGRVAHRAAEVLEADLLAGDRPDHVGPGDEHVRGLLDHEHEVRDRGGVDRAARARAHDQRDLRDHARAADVAQEDVAVGAERDDALLDAGAAGVVDPDHGAADLGRQVHDLAHLLGHDLAQRAAEDREVLAEHAHPAAVDRAVAGHHRVAVGPVLLHLEVRGPVADIGVELLEGPRVQQLVDPLAGRVLALRVLLLDGLVLGVVADRGAQLLEPGEPLRERLGSLLTHRPPRVSVARKPVRTYGRRARRLRSERDGGVQGNGPRGRMEGRR